MEIKPKKRLGQNFLINEKILDKIVKVGEITDKDNILEIGPGTGNLTKYLINSKPKSIIVIEKDTDLISLLNLKFKDCIEIVNEDVLNLHENFFKKKFKVFGNLPYNISTKILSNWCLSKNIKFEKLILMFQKEVADRIISKFNTKNYGRLSILSNWKLDIKKVLDVNPSCFFPRPKVDSTVLFFEIKKNFIQLKNPSNLEKITKIFFSQRRKMIKKPYNLIFNDNNKIAEKLDIRLNLRPQNLNLDTYLKIAYEYEKLIS